MTTDSYGDRLRKILSGEREPIASLTVKLVKCATENPPGRGYRDCLQVLGDELDGLGFESRIALVPGESSQSDNPRYFLRSQLGDSGPAVYFHGHYDVVPAQHPERQFEPRCDERVIFGRGSSDMKGGLSSMIFAMKALRDLNQPLSGRIILQVVPDEETGGARGSAALARSGQLVERDAIGMLTAEPTSGCVWHASRGAITMEIRVKGRGSHVGLQFLGSNAFEKMLPLAEDLMELKANVETRRTRVLVDPEPAANSILMMGGVSGSGENFNVVPAVFRFSLDRRFNPEEDLEEEKAAIFEIIDRHRAAGMDIDVHVFQQAQSAHVGVDSKLARCLSASLSEVTGKDARFEMCPGILEIRFYDQVGVPALAYGPGLLSVSHGPDEFVHRDELEVAANVYALTAARLLGL